MSDKETQLVKIEPSKAYDVFTTPNGLVEILNRIDHDALALAPDLSTASGRKAIASNAYRVAQTKTYLDNLGKEIVDKLKELPKKVDANRKYARETLDALKDKVRQPLTEWEAEQARIEAEKKALEEAAKLAAEIEQAHEIALLMNDSFDRKKEEEARQAEEARKEREAEIVRQAIEQARIEAENKAKAERELAEKALLEAKLAQERAERAKSEAEVRAKAELEALEKLLREEQAAKERVEAEAKAKREAEEAKAAADRNHRASVNSAIVSSLHGEADISIELAKKIVILAAKGKLGKLIIDYRVTA